MTAEERAEAVLDACSHTEGADGACMSCMIAAIRAAEREAMERAADEAEILGEQAKTPEARGTAFLIAGRIRALAEHIAGFSGEGGR